jgi:hypothetical protein
MKINGSNPLGAGGPVKGGARSGGSGFHLSQTDEPAQTASTSRASGPTGIGSIDALMALQEVGGPLERRRRAVKRAGRILDVLDEVKISLLEGEVPAQALNALVQAVHHARDATGDPGLEAILNDIETRAAVEIAKLEPQK